MHMSSEIALAVGVAVYSRVACAREGIGVVLPCARFVCFAATSRNR